MTTVTDDQIQELAATGKPFSLVQLTWADRNREDADAIELEHQRRMVRLRADGVVAVLAPVLTDTVCGVAILTQEVAEARETMAEDPCVQAGMMTAVVLPCVGFPGDTIPG